MDTRRIMDMQSQGMHFFEILYFVNESYLKYYFSIYNVDDCSMSNAIMIRRERELLNILKCSLYGTAVLWALLTGV